MNKKELDTLVYRIEEYRTILNNSFESDDIHHGQQLLRLWCMNVIDECIKIISDDIIQS